MPEVQSQCRLNRKDHERVKSLRALQNFDHAFDSSFSLVAYIANRFLVDHMLRAGRLLTDNDFESMVIWGLLAHQNVAPLMPPGTVPTAVLTERGRLIGEDAALKPLKLRDIAAISGIPRETVRRKLDKLAASRFVRRVPEGWVVIGDRVEPDLREFTRDTVIRLAAVFEEVLAALQQVDGQSDAKRTSPARADQDGDA